MKTMQYKVRVWSVFLTIIAGAVFIGILIFYENIDNRHYDTTVTALEENWTTSDGSVYSLTGLPVGPVEVTKDLSGLSTDHMRFCTRSIDTYFDVYADGEKIYSYQKNIPKIAGASYGMYMHMVPLPKGTKQLRLVLTPAFNWEKTLMTQTVLADAGMYMGDFFLHEIPNFSICVLMLMIGISMIIIGANGMMGEEFLSLGLIACFTALWSVNDTLLLQILTQRPELVRAISYICFAMMPYPPLAFISKITGNKKHMPLTAMTVIIVLNTLAVIILNATGAADFHITVHATRTIIVLAILLSLYFMINAIRKGELNRRLLTTLSIGIAFFVAGSAIDLLRNALTDSVITGSGLYTRLGIFIFLILFIRYIIIDYNRVLIENNNTQMMKKLAYTDALTGLNNRLAFNEKETDLKNKENNNCIIIQLDINNLKQVNDVYGHSEGDKHIRAAAAIIEESFKEFGICYRTGGDEFITVISPHGGEQGAKKAIEKMLRKSQEYNEKENPPVKLQIAHGFAVCTNTSTELEKTELLADQRMYECKRKMKEENKKSEK